MALNFRSDLQGMRGIAVLSVVAFHVFPALVQSGYYGVDVFFVLSGFFISSALFSDIKIHGTVRLAEFWARRIRRILPLATLVIVVTCLLAWQFGDPYELAAEAMRLRDAALYWVNWRFVFTLTSDYFQSKYVSY